MKPKQPEISALTVASGRIGAAGTDDDVLARTTADTKRIDLNGRRVIPGLNDSRLHVIRAGLFIAEPNVLILYSTIARAPKLTFEDQLNSSRHYMREL